VLEQLLVVHCVRHLRYIHGRPEILHTVKKPMHERERALSPEGCLAVLSAGKFQYC
jgi:hypothetical protein